MPFCQKCGRERGEDEAFCQACGTPGVVSATRAMPSVYDAPGYATQTSAIVVGSQFIGQWNWGASFLAPYWLMTHRRVGLGILWFFLQLVPLVGFIGLVYFGLNGNKIAVASGRFRDDTQFVAVENAWRNWSFGFLGLGVLLIIVGAVGTHR